MKHRFGIILVCLTLALALVALAPAAFAQNPGVCAQDYTVVAGDWLSKIAQANYGNAQAYPAIFAATNLQSRTHEKYATILSPAALDKGMVLCVPSKADAAAYNNAPVPAGLTLDLLKNATYTSMYGGENGGPLTLTNGKYSKGEPGSGDVVYLSLDGPIAYGELNGTPSAAVVTGASGGGSGYFSELHVMQVQAGKPTDVAFTLLGDRVSVLSVAIVDNQIVVDMITQGPDEPACCGTQRTLVTFQLDGNQLTPVSTVILGAWNPDTNTTTLAGSATPAASATTTSPATTSTPSAATLTGLHAEDIHFDSQNLGKDIQGAVVATVPYSNDEPPGPIGAPAHVQYTFDGEPRLWIIPVQAYETLWNQKGDKTITNAVTQLQTLLKDKPASPPPPLPFLPPPGGENDFATRVHYLDFDGGSGIAYVGRYAQDPSPITRGLTFYTFLGLTNDIKHLVAFRYPVETSALPASSDDISASQMTQVENDFQTYRQQTTALLNSLPTSAFGPDLQRLDGLVKSLHVPQ